MNPSFILNKHNISKNITKQKQIKIMLADLLLIFLLSKLFTFRWYFDLAKEFCTSSQFGTISLVVFISNHLIFS